MSKWLRAGDQVIVIAGNDRGREGKILKRDKEKVVVEGINVRKKHMRPTRENQKGQIIDVERPIHISKVQLSQNGSPVKLRVRVNQDGEKELFYRVGKKKEELFRKVKK